MAAESIEQSAICWASDNLRWIKKLANKTGRSMCGHQLGAAPIFLSLTLLIYQLAHVGERFHRHDSRDFQGPRQWPRPVRAAQGKRSSLNSIRK
jgi:hypothetical protein